MSGTFNAQINDNTLTVKGDMTNQSLTKDARITHASLFSLSHCNIDLAGVTHVDSAGLAWLINLLRDAQQHKVEVTFSHVPDTLYKLATLSNAESLITDNAAVTN